MQGKKVYQEQLFMTFQLSQHVPATNFYRRLKSTLDLSFLYKETKVYYGTCGQKSIDPVVFYKLCLVGYLENIISHRQLVESCSMRLDILYFLGYNIDDEFPWHSTISRRKQLFPESVFEKVFERVLAMCVDKGMVSGHTQAIDSAFIKANASMESLELKVPKETLEEHLQKIRHISSADRPAKNNKACEDQKTIDANIRKLKEIKSRQKKWSKDQDQRPGSGAKGSKYTSNKTHYSPTDPDARISVKPGKARKLNFLSQLAVDTGHHVITHISADYADKKDNQCIENVVNKLQPRLRKTGLLWANLLADAGYSSGQVYALLEKLSLQSFIPPHGTYKGGPEGFTLNKAGNYWVCPQGKHVTFRKVITDKATLKNLYLTRKSDCVDCPIKAQCIKKSPEKKITITVYKDEYDRAIKRVKSKQGQYMKRKRHSTVEPVFGTLINFLGLRKVNTLGIKQANKAMLMAAVAYNLKKYMKNVPIKTEVMCKCMKEAAFLFIDLIYCFLNPNKALKFETYNFLI
jgi:transposase